MGDNTCTTSSLLYLFFEQKSWFRIMDPRRSCLETNLRLYTVKFSQTTKRVDFLKILSNKSSLACWFYGWKRTFSIVARQIYKWIFLLVT